MQYSRRLFDTLNNKLAKAPAHTKQKCSYYGSSHPHWQCPAHWGLKENKPLQNHVQVQQWGTVHGTEQEATNENQSGMVNINSINFNSKQSVAVAKLKNLIKSK